MKQQTQIQSVKCEKCGKIISGTNGLPFPTDYVWRDGRVVCWECIRKKSSNT